MALSNRFDVTSYTPTHDLEYDAWVKDGTILCDMHDLLPFAIGDWINFGEQIYGEKYGQALALTGLDYSTLIRYSMVSKAFPPSRRRSATLKNKLTWSHYRHPLPLTEDEQEKWLDRCEDNNLNVRELKSALSVSKETSDPTKDAAAEFSKLVNSVIQQIPPRAVDLMTKGEGVFKDTLNYPHDNGLMQVEFQIRIIPQERTMPDGS